MSGNTFGGHSSGKRTDNGRLYFGDKDAAYLKKMSREAVEGHHDVSLLYFEIDWQRSKRNFYGELIARVLKNPMGIQVRGMIKMNQNEELQTQGVPYKTMRLVFSCYTEHLKELGIEPKLGDYFSFGQRVYNIYDKTLKDYGPGNLIANRERMRIDYLCYQEDDEVFQKDCYGDNLGMEYQLRPGNGDITKS